MYLFCDIASRVMLGANTVRRTNIIPAASNMVFNSIHKWRVGVGLAAVTCSLGRERHEKGRVNPSSAVGDMKIYIKPPAEKDATKLA